MGNKKDVFSPKLRQKINRVLGMGDRLRRKLSKEPNVVWVTYDPLLENIICVHDVPDCVCEVCKPVWEERQREKCIYQLEERKFEIKEYDKNELEEV